MSFNFKEFKDVGAKLTPVISLGEHSGFGISSGFSHKYDMKDIVATKMYYDDEKKVIAFKFLKQKEKGTVGVKMREKGGYINAKSFLKTFKIDQSVYWGRYEPEEILDEGLGKIYVIYLKEKSVS